MKASSSAAHSLLVCVASALLLSLPAASSTPTTQLGFQDTLSFQDALGWSFDTTDKLVAQKASLNLAKLFDVDGKGNLDMPKLTALYDDWLATNSYAVKHFSFDAFASNLKLIVEINTNPLNTYIASGNAFTGLDLTTFLNGYTGALEPSTQRRSAMSTEHVSHDEASSSLQDPSSVSTSSDEVPHATAEDPAADSSNRKLRGLGSAALSTNLFKNTFVTPSPSPSPKFTLNADLFRVSKDWLLPFQYGINWVNQGKVTAVKNQGGCGSCWAFAATAAMESAYLISGKGGNININLSEQQLVSCVNTASSGYASNGCSGGWSDNAMDYIKDYTQNKDSLWPYTATTGTCNQYIFPSSTGQSIKAGAYSTTVSPTNSVAAIKAALAKSPIVFYFRVEGSFQSYASGIYNPANCGTTINHAMLLVGYGKDFVLNQEYWIVKNSWGTNWGENGYARIAITGDGTVGPCGMYKYAYAPPLSFSGTPLTAPYS